MEPSSGTVMSQMAAQMGKTNMDFKWMHQNGAIRGTQNLVFKLCFFRLQVIHNNLNKETPRISILGLISFIYVLCHQKNTTCLTHQKHNYYQLVLKLTCVPLKLPFFFLPHLFYVFLLVNLFIILVIFVEKSFIFSWADMKKMRTNSPRISEPKGFTSTCFLAVVDWKISQSWVWAQNASKLFHHFDFFFFF